MAWSEWFWIVLCVTAIVVDIALSLNKTDGDTLSEYVRKWFALDKRGGRAWQYRRLAMLFFLSYIAFHWLLGWV